MNKYIFLHLNEIDSLKKYVIRNYTSIPTFCVLSSNVEKDYNKYDLNLAIIIKDEILYSKTIINECVLKSFIKSLSFYKVKVKLKNNKYIINDHIIASHEVIYLISGYVIFIHVNVNGKHKQNKNISLRLQTGLQYDICKLKKLIVKNFDNNFKIIKSNNLKDENA